LACPEATRHLKQALDRDVDADADADVVVDVDSAYVSNNVKRKILVRFPSMSVFASYSEFCAPPLRFRISSAISLLPY
jgi:hypothetical protein